MRTIWLASYPKSGNTWLRILLANVIGDSAQPADINNLALRGGIASARERFDRVTLIDSGLLTFEEIDALRPGVHAALAAGDEDDDAAPAAGGPVNFVKVHDAYTLTPSGMPSLGGSSGAAGAVCVVRDPRDIAPSLAHHSRFSIDEAITFMADESASFCGKRDRQHRQLRQRLLGWSSHLASWLDQKDLPVHLVRYEDLQTAPVATLLTALAFAGIAAASVRIERAIELSAFDALASQEHDKGFREAPPQRRFFRRGESGSWRDEITTEQAARIEQAHGGMMRRLGYMPAATAAMACRA